LLNLYPPTPVGAAVGKVHGRYRWKVDSTGRAARAVNTHDLVVVEVQIPARPSNGRVSQRGDKANGVRQRGHACSGAHCMLGVTRTQGRRAMSRQPRSRICCCRGSDACETKRRASQPARRQGKRGAAARACELWRSGRRKGKLGAGMRILSTRTLSPNSDSRGPTLVEGAGADQVDALVRKIQIPRKSDAGAGADERRPCSHTRRSQSQSVGVINAVHGERRPCSHTRRTQSQCAGMITAVHVSRTAWHQS
jgi:hypothetical protein